MTNVLTKIRRFLSPYKEWLVVRKKSEDENKEKLCYCGHTFKCQCSDPDKALFNESVKRGSIILWDENNGWETN